MQEIKIEKIKKEQLIEEIKKYFFNESGEDIGNLRARMILEFFLEKLGPVIYNQGVNDAHAYMKNKLDEVFEIEIYKKR
ncbi:MAG: DUF2164 family protein [Thermotogota bacterium]